MKKYKMEFLPVILVLSTQFLMTSQTVDICSPSYPGGAICKCTMTASSLSYDCRARNISNLLGGYKNTATALNLSNNKITSVYVGPLNNLRTLATLYLQANLIQTIESGSFNGMMALRQLLLTSNQLSAIGRDVFRHLPSLEVLDLSNNRIATIDRYAFITLPSAYNIDLGYNPLRCGCEEYLLQEFFEMRKEVLEVKNKPCNTLLTEETPCNSGETLFNSPTSCYQCQDAASFQDCDKQMIIDCSAKNSMCYSQIDYYYPGHLSISGGCTDLASCLYQEQRNGVTCFNDTGTGTTCYFCNPDRLSNAQDETNTTKQFYATLLITLVTQMTAQLQDTSSSTYKSFTMNLEIEIHNYIRGQLGGFIVEFLDLRPPQVTLAFRIRCSTLWFNTPSDVMQAIATSLKRRRINGFSVETVEIFLSTRDAPCPAETTEHPTYGKFTWPTTNPGTSSYIQCPYQLYNNRIAKYASRNCERQSNNSGLWKQPLLSDCPHADENSRELQALAESDINEGNAEEVSSTLSNLTANWQDFASAQITWSVDIIYGILKTNLARASRNTISNTLETVNNLLFIKSDILQQAEIESKSSNRIVQGVQVLLDGVSVTSDDYLAVKENIAGIVSGVKASTFKGLTMAYGNSGSKTLTDTKMSYRKEDEVTEEGQSGIALPRTMFDTLRQGQRNSIDKITISVFRDPKLFSSITQTNETKLIQGDDGDMIPAERKINSNIIGASVPATPVKDLQTPVVVTLPHLHTGKNVSCVYWDVDSSTWSADGCNVNKTTDDYTVCHCNHLTNFALLMDVYSTGASSLALSIISYVGCGLSLLGVLLTLITYLKFRKLRRGNPSKILMNLCLSIGLVDIVFLLGVQEYSGNSDSGCKVVAILLHYFLLTSMCWMAVEAFYMYLALVKVFDTYVAHFQLKSSLFGWCTPFLVVAITLGINKSENYGLQPGGICWLDRLPFYAAFLTPVCLLLLANTIIYLLVIRRIVNRGTKKMTKSDPSSTIVRLRGAVSVFVLLGLTWVFGVLAFDGVGEAFHYIFALLNSLQGFFIFIFYCVLKKEAQQCWRQALPCLKSPYEKDTSSNTRNKGDSSTTDSNKTTKSNFNSKDSASQVSKSVEDEPKNNTVFRGNWHVQIPDPKQKTSFV